MAQSDNETENSDGAGKAPFDATALVGEAGQVDQLEREDQVALVAKPIGGETTLGATSWGGATEEEMSGAGTTTIDRFRQSLSAAEPPPGADLAVQALWWVGKGDWNRAHACAQQREGDPDCDLMHAHLHRREGDATNSRYWYRQAGQPVSALPLDEEWASIAAKLLNRTHGAGSTA